MGMKADRGFGRQHRGADDDLLAGYPRLVVMREQRTRAGCGLGSSAQALNDSAMTATKDNWNSVRMGVLLIAE
jgi:hypothetical protein